MLWFWTRANVHTSSSGFFSGRSYYFQVWHGKKLQIRLNMSEFVPISSPEGDPLQQWPNPPSCAGCRRRSTSKPNYTTIDPKQQRSLLQRSSCVIQNSLAGRPWENKKRKEGRQALEPWVEPWGTRKSWWNKDRFLEELRTPSRAVWEKQKVKNNFDKNDKLVRHVRGHVWFIVPSKLKKNEWIDIPTEHSWKSMVFQVSGVKKDPASK